MEMRPMLTWRACCFLLPLFSLLLLLPAAWAGDIAGLIESRMDEVRDNRPFSFDTGEIMAADGQLVQDALRPYEHASSARVRHAAYLLGWKIAMQSRSATIRQEEVIRLIKASQDDNPLVWQQAGKWLLQFQRSDFPASARRLLLEQISSPKPRAESMLIAGVADLTEGMDVLRRHLIDESRYETGEQVGRWYGTVGWAARLALARLGSEPDIEKVVLLVESETDDVVRVTRLLGSLAYVRQPRTIAVLGEYLESDARLPRQRPDVPGTRYCQYAANLLARILAGFPVKSVGPGGYSQEEIELCRDWMRGRTTWPVIR